MSSLAISFLVICKDNYAEFVRTFNSLFMQMTDFDEILIVDSSRTSCIELSFFLSLRKAG